jgi:hypothetical protein
MSKCEHHFCTEGGVMSGQSFSATLSKGINPDKLYQQVLCCKCCESIFIVEGETFPHVSGKCCKDIWDFRDRLLFSDMWGIT